MSTTFHQHPACRPDADLLADCRVERTRGTGPGGQHRNKVETAIRITHGPTGLRGEAGERRSQEQNRKQALFRLRLHLAVQYRAETDLPAYEPSELWLSRCTKNTIAINPTHADFPAVLAEALDVIAAVQYEPKTAATILHCSMSQLVKLLKKEPQALVLVNEQRQFRGVHPLK